LDTATAVPPPRPIPLPADSTTFEKLAKFWLLALLSEFSTATRDERITINVPATIH
jgi:hypothetical protein